MGGGFIFSNTISYQNTSSITTPKAEIWFQINTLRPQSFGHGGTMLLVNCNVTKYHNLVRKRSMRYISPYNHRLVSTSCVPMIRKAIKSYMKAMGE